MKNYLILCAAPLLIGAAPATDAETIKDVRCFLAMSSVANSEDKMAAMAGVMGAQYFFGRIDGRSPNLDLETIITAETSRLTEADMKPLMEGCGQLMKTRGQLLQAIGKKMEAKGPSS